MAARDKDRPRKSKTTPIARNRTPADCLLAAASIGLMPEHQPPAHLSDDQARLRYLLQHLERADYCVRLARAGDLAELKVLERRCWPKGLRTRKSVLRKRIEAYPQGQLVLTIDDAVVGVIYSQRISDVTALDGITAARIDRLHDGKAGIVQLLAVNILPERQHLDLGDRLLEFMLIYRSLQEDVASVMAVTLCRSFDRARHGTPDDYLRQRNEHGALADPILRFHELHGATIERVVPGYRPADLRNEGNGVLVTYDIRRRSRRDVAVSGVTTQRTRPELRGDIEAAVRACLGAERQAEFAPARPLMEMGLDSADLLQLREIIAQQHQVRLNAAFFFEHNTVEKIADHLGDRPNLQPPPTRHAEAKASRDVAIVGMACRLPGGIETPDAFWEALKAGLSAIGSVPAGRWQWPDGIDPAGRHPGIDRGGFLQDVASFDAPFFRISPAEAQSMDPQQRLLLELGWQAILHAGYAPQELAGSATGVFIGASGSDYARLLDQSGQPAEAHYGTGSSMAVLANRLSYFFDLQGPSLLIDTACSSSLVALHKAVQSIASGESAQALVGGVNLILHPANSIAYYKAGMLAKDGLCKTFDRRADGYVRSEGAVVLLLKPLAMALAERDTIHAVIKGTACNHGGLASGLTVPKPGQQAALLQAAWRDAGIDPAALGYIEAHGTGTALGDPIEVQGIREALGSAEVRCGLGSVKTNLGHLEAAAGLAGVLKTVLCLQHGEIPASLHFRELNEHIDLPHGLFVVDRPTPWPGPRLAGVSSFGSGGTNAHVVVAEAPALDEATAVDSPKRRVALPPHPFARHRYWVPGVEMPEEIAPALLAPVWNRVEVGAPGAIDAKTKVLIVGGNAVQHQAIRAICPKATMDIADPDRVFWIAQHDLGVLPLFCFVKSLLAKGYGERTLDLTLVTSRTQAVFAHDAIDATHAGIQGFAGALAKEQPRWSIRALDMDGEEEWPIREALALPPNADGEVRAHRNGVWFQRALAPVSGLPKAPPPYRQNGIYVVVGGAGGIGEAWTRHVVERYQAQVVWIGRRPLDAAIQAMLDGIAARGPAPIYLSADASVLASLQTAHAAIRQRWPAIHGVIHAATGAFDRSIAEMEEARFAGILSVKVDASLNVAKVFEAEPLDFLLYFSSVVALEKDGGLSGYAAGGAFQDALALQLAGRGVPARVVNWGHWQVGTGAALAETRKTRLRRSGHLPIESAEAMTALASVLASPLRQVAVLKTSRLESMPLVDAGRRLLVAADTIPSCIGQIPSASAADIEALRPSSLFANKAMEEALLPSLAMVLGKVDRKNVVGSYGRWLAASTKLLAGSVSDQVPNWRDQAPAAAVELSEACLQALPDILTGRVRATDVLFPGSSMRRVEGIYRGNAVADHFNRVLVDALVAAIEARLKDDPEARIRILEVGAGTGGTTASVLPKLAPFRHSIVEYAYTDLSKAFLFHAEEQFVGPYPFVQPKLFDIEKPLAGQGIEPQRYDFVVATNVLHATRDIRRTLANCKAALARNGLLLLNEIGTPSLFAHLTFGLLEGWWLSQDQALRMPDAPGLLPATWQRVLKQEGFPAVFFPAPESHVLGQQVIVAESDGVAWQEETVAAQPPAKAATPRAVVASAAPETLKAAANALLRKLVARTLRMDASDVDVDEPLEAYGIDSILVVQIVDALRESFSDVRSTLLFECQTVDALAEHFVRNHADEVARLTGVRVEESVAPIVRPSVREAPAVADDSIAVIGMSCRFPQVPTVEAFWQLLKSGRDCVGEIPEDRWPLEGFFHADPDEAVQRGKSYAKWGAFLDGVTEFDPLFFNISPKDAVAIDPQERLFLQTAWAALEDAGYTRQRLAQDFDRRLGVFVGITRTGFDLFGPDLWRQGETLYPHTSFSSVANRLSYFLDARGPSVPVDTMCSSSLTAIHQACQSLRGGECRLAIAGGVNVYLHPSGYVGLSASRMLSKDGLCRSFGKGGDGFVPGEGVAAVLLKPLSKAIADGDRIQAVIRATHVNHGGKTNGYTVPNPQAQAELVREALEKAGVDARAISYVEAHGTGTELGDPIEVTGLTQAFRHFTSDTGFCALGSAKTNIGHLEAAAGIAGFIKVVLQMQHRQLAPSLHSAELNPGIDFARTPFVVQQRLEAWQTAGPRLAGISSFGAGGANAHVVVEEYAAPVQASVASPHGAVIVLSARNEERLKIHAGCLRDFIASGAPDLSDLAYTLQVGREQMEQRLAFVVHSLEELRQRLEDWLAGSSGAGETYAGNARQHRDMISAFANDAAMQDTIGVWFTRGEHARVLGLWSKGLNVDWRAFHPAPGRLIGLPTYPFETTRYWLPVVRQEKIVEAEKPAVARSQGIKLQDPALLPTTFGVDTALRQHTLRPLESYAPAEEAALSVRDLGDGILAIGAHGQTSAAGARAGLAACIEWVNASLPKVLVLGGLDRLFPDGDTEARTTLATCAVPTIALPDAGSMEPACDIAAASEEAALATAHDIARASTTALVELKRNLSRGGKGSGSPWPAVPVVASVQAVERVALRSEVVTLDRQANGVVLVTLCDRAARNTSSPDLVRGVIEAFEHIRATPAYKAVVLTGYDTYFACGGTKEGLLAIQSGAIRFTDEQSYALPLACDIPVIAAMQGHGIGAGWAMGLFCDWAVYSEESVYRSPYMLYGFTPGAGSTLVFPHRLGDGLAREILFTARDFTGRELKQRGIDTPVVPRKDVLARALSLANHLAASSRQELVQRKAERSRALRDQLPSVFARELAMHDKTFVGNAQVVANVERHFNVGVGQEEAVPASKAGGSVPDRASQQEVLETLTQSLADELLMRREQVDENAAFTDIGMDSISAVMWVKKINSRFGLSLTATKVYHYPSLKQFADFVLSQMGERQPAGAVGVAAAEPPKPPRESVPVRTFALVEPPQETAPQIAPRETSPAIAIIGMAGQFPKASDVKQFWRNIAEARECVSDIPPSRWSIDAYYDADRSAAGKTVCRRMGFLDDVDLFDPLFFNISPSEAELMDPQQRLFLQTSWHCIEDAGYNPRDLSGTSCGVFVGCAASDYSQLVAGGANSAQALIGESVSILPARIAYFLNLQGPCLAIDTACSASLVALATACDSLVLGNSDLALAGGVYVINGPDIHVKMSSAGMLSPDGRCFSFDQRANGFVPGEGVGVVLLKRLADAERDGDDIYAVVRGWGVNQDGKTNGITAPNQESQTRLETGIYRKFGIDPEHIQLVEAHGTGTKLGDPIEVDALCSSFRQFTGKEQFCALGSVKTNIGHLATAAGVAGVIKSVLALQKKQLPPTINYQSLNEHIRLQGSPFYVNTECRPWPADPGSKRLAAVSSFGFSGTNAHVVLEEYAPRRPVARSAAATPQLFTLSARSREQLAVYARAVVEYLTGDHDPREMSLADLAHSFRVGRPVFEHRATFAVRSVDELRQQLERYIVTGEAGAPSSQAIDAGEGCRRHGLPAYPFERERYWAAPVASEEWQAAELTDAIDWQGRFRHILARQILVVHTNGEARNAFDHLLVQLKQATGVEKASVTYCAAAELATAAATLRPGHLVNLDEGTILTGGHRRLVVGQSDRGDLNVVMQRLFKEWLAFDASGAKLREIRYAGARRLVRLVPVEEASDSICTLAKEWRLKAPEPLAQPPRRGTLLLLVNAETASFAARLLEKDFDESIMVDEANLGDVRLAERYDSVTHLVDLTDLHGEAADGDGDPSGKVALYQALVGTGSDLSILHLTKSLQSFRSTRLSLAGAKFAGLVRMLSAEYRHVNARGLDIDQLVLDDPQRLRRILLQEFDATLQETELCYREGHRFAPFLTATEGDDPAPDAFRIDPAAVYVISGGTNGVGLEIAKVLVGKGCRKLVLMGITELPPKESWPAAVAKGDLSPYVVAKLGELMALDKRLDHLGIYTGALTAQAVLRSYFVKVRATVGPIRGVIHGAAVYSDAGSPAFAGKKPASMRQVWDVKMGGLESLQAIFKADPLDFFVAFSSMTALVPRLARGASDYAMANGFVEFFTAYHRRQPGGERFRSIMWSDWNQTGAITRIAPDRARAVRETFERLGLRTFSNQEGAMLFERAMTGAEGVSIVGHVNRERFDEVAPHLLFADPESPDGPRPPAGARPQSLKAVPRSILHQLEHWEAEKRAGGTIPIERILEVISLEEIKRIDPAQIHRLHKVMFGEAVQAAPPEPPVDHAEIVAGTVRDVLKLKSVDPAKPFQDYGLDSISATVLATRLEKKLKREVQPKWLIDFPTVDALVHFLMAEDEASLPRAAAPSTPAE